MTTRSIPWLRVLIEGVVIVGSILLAFGIDAWWEGRQERAEERSILVEVGSEFEANLVTLDQTAAAHRRGLDAMQSIVAASVSPIPDASLDSLFPVAANTPHYNPATGALAATISSGRISLVRDVDLRNRLAGWDAVVSDLVLDEQTRRDFVVHELRPTLAEFGIGGSPSAVSVSNSDFAGALRSRELMAHLRSQIRLVAHLLTHFDEAFAATESMLADVSKALSR